MADRGARAAAGGVPDNRVFGSGYVVILRINGPLHLYSDCANSVGSRAAASEIEYRWAEGRSERAAGIVVEFVRLKVNVIVTAGAVVLAARQHAEGRQATSTIPIVFATAGEHRWVPVLLQVCPDRGAMLTGLSNQQSDLAAKRLELLREVVPGLRRLAILANVSNPASLGEMPEVERSARELGIEPITAEVRRGEDIAPAFEALKGRVEALCVCSDFLMFTHRVRINTLTLGARLPTIYGEREMVELGGLMSYGPNFPELFRRAADSLIRYYAVRNLATFRSSNPRSSI